MKKLVSEYFIRNHILYGYFHFYRDRKLACIIYEQSPLPKLSSSLLTNLSYQIMWARLQKEGMVTINRRKKRTRSMWLQWCALWKIRTTASCVGHDRTLEPPLWIIVSRHRFTWNLNLILISHVPFKTVFVNFKNILILMAE